MDDVLRRLQLTQLEMLKVFDRICRENGLSYSLYAGTLLGAVRHRGFIPWDDDLDVCMPRADYDQFIALWPETEHAGYSLQNKQNTPAFSQSFTKIRKDGTTFLQDAEETADMHTGIFIDVFPVDRLPDGKAGRRLFFWRCMRYQLYTREFVPTRNGRLLRLGSSVLLALTPAKRRPALRERLLRRLTACNGDTHCDTVMTEVVKTMRIPMPPALLDSYVDLPFEDGTFSCFALWDEYLTRKFGDYRQHPPAEEQTWKHRPVVLDFEHSRDSLIGENQ